MASKSHRKLTPAFEAFAHFTDDALHLRIDRRVLQSVQGAHDRHARLEQGMNLPTEEQQVDVRDLGFGQRDVHAAGRRLGRLRPRFLDLDRRQPLPAQNIDHRTRTGALKHAFKELAGGIATFVSKSRHSQKVE